MTSNCANHSWPSFLLQSRDVSSEQKTYEEKLGFIFFAASIVGIHHRRGASRRLITAHNGRSPEQVRNWIRGGALGSSDLMSAKERRKGEQIAGDNAGLLMGKDLSAQLKSLLVLLISYIYSKWTVCTSGPFSDSRIPSKIKYQQVLNKRDSRA